MSKPAGKAAAITGDALLVKKSPSAAIGTLQRGQRPSDAYIPLNFRVPAEFHQLFKQLCLDARLKNVQLLVRAIEAWEREQEAEENRRTKR